MLRKYEQIDAVDFFSYSILWFSNDLLTFTFLNDVFKLQREGGWFLAIPFRLGTTQNRPIESNPRIL